MKWKQARIIQFFEKTLILPHIAFLKQGLSTKKLALSFALGVTLGIFPVIGLTTVLCAVVALIFRLNMPSIQMVNYFVSPLQLLLVMPFIRFGEFLFNEPHLPFDVFQIIALLQSDFIHAVGFLWWSTLHAVAVWVLIAPVVIVAFYYLSLPFIIRLHSKEL